MTRRIITLATLLVLAATLATAEVTVAQSGGTVVPHIIRPIIDDPEPVGIVWDVYRPVSPERVPLNPTGSTNGDGNPSMIVGVAPAVPVVAWARNSASGYDVVLSSFDGGAWSPPVVLADGPGNQLDPVLTVDGADGTIHVVWWTDDGTPRVMHRQAPGDLSSWSTPEQVSPAGALAIRPSAVVHDGTLAVAFELHDQGQGATPRQIMLALREGTSFSSHWLASTTFQPANWPQVHTGRNRLWVDWIDASGEMTWIEGGPFTGWSPIGVQPFAGPAERDFGVRRRIQRTVLD